jgi:hypothetical protein
MTEENTLKNTPLLSNRLYETLKTLVQLWLPALGTLYFTLATIWGLPAAEAVVATLAAIAAFGGVVLRISAKSYAASDSRYDGAIVISQPEPGKTLYSLELGMDPDEIKDLNELVFKVAPTVPAE